MTISVDWDSKVVTIPKADLTLISGSLYEYDVGTTLRAELKAAEASEEGMTFLDIHRHSTEKILSGITYARFVEIINGYQVEFEDGTYGVILFGANHNVADEGILIRNQVSVTTNNSAGLTVPTTPQDIWAASAASPTPGSMGEALVQSRDSIVLGVSTAQAGCTESVLKTGLTETAGFYNGMLVQVMDGVRLLTRAVDVSEADGTLYLAAPLPFVPPVGAEVRVLAAHAGATGRVG